MHRSREEERMYGEHDHRPKEQLSRDTYVDTRVLLSDRARRSRSCGGRPRRRHVRAPSQSRLSGWSQKNHVWEG
jgi:hypothetical protein